MMYMERLKSMENLIKQFINKGYLNTELIQELNKQPYYFDSEIDVCAIDFDKHGEFFLKLILGTQLKYSYKEEVFDDELIEIEMPRELVPFLLDFNRVSPFILFDGKYFAAYVSKYLELILVTLKEKPDDNYLIFDVSI